MTQREMVKQIKNSGASPTTISADIRQVRAGSHNEFIVVDGQLVRVVRGSK